jgi:hypothetical protein
MLIKYERPLSEFLNKYAGLNRNPGAKRLGSLAKLFHDAVSIFLEALGAKPFRLTKTLNVAV